MKAGARVLVVEDDPYTARLLIRKTTAAGLDRPSPAKSRRSLPASG